MEDVVTEGVVMEDGVMDDVSLPAFRQAVRRDLARLPLDRSYSSRHEAHGVLRRAVEEFHEAASGPPERLDKGRMLLALLRVAAVAEKAAEDLGLVEREGGEL